jgi:regulator of replication initiation timing
MISAALYGSAWAQDTTRIIAGGKTIIIITNPKVSKGNNEINIDDMLDSLEQIEILEEEILIEIPPIDFPDSLERSRYVDSLHKEAERIRLEAEELRRRIEREAKEMKEERNKDDRGRNETKTIEWDKEDKAKAHWDGLELGTNWFINSNNRLAREDPNFDLDYSKSLVFNFNFFEQAIGFAKGHAAIVTGMGVTFNHFAWRNPITLDFDQNGTWATLTDDRKFEKNKLNAGYLTLPLMLELHTSPLKKKGLSLAFGAQGGFRLYSKAKQEYVLNSDSYDSKIRDHYNINPWRADIIARLGYRNFTFFANYPLTQFFEKDKGPELYTFQVGIRLLDGF